MEPRFIQLHFLASYPIALLNRDDAGFAKRIPFGGVSRTRISSQCLKRHWRTYSGEHSLKSLDVAASIRSRYTFEQYFFKPLCEKGIPENIARLATTKTMEIILGESPKAKASKEEDDESMIRTSQITILGSVELDYLRDHVLRLCQEISDEKELVKSLKSSLGSREMKSNLKALKNASGLDAALFGRMVTSDILARGDAAMHVAHAFTVHAESTESDYFSAVDDLHQELGELGSGHIGSVELTSGLYYGYVVVDVPLLVSNLEGCPQKDWEKADKNLSVKVIQSLVNIICTVSPGAKLGSTAPYSYANMLITEIGNSQPRTFANAFLNPVRETPDVIENTYKALAEHIKDMNAMYDYKNEVAVSGLKLEPGILEVFKLEKKVSLSEQMQWIGEKYGCIK